MKKITILAVMLVAIVLSTGFVSASEDVIWLKEPSYDVDELSPIINYDYDIRTSDIVEDEEQRLKDIVDRREDISEQIKTIDTICDLLREMTGSGGNSTIIVQA